MGRFLRLRGNDGKRVGDGQDGNEGGMVGRGAR